MKRLTSCGCGRPPWRKKPSPPSGSRWLAEARRSPCASAGPPRVPASRDVGANAGVCFGLPQPHAQRLVMHTDVARYCPDGAPRRPSELDGSSPDLRGVSALLLLGHGGSFPSPGDINSWSQGLHETRGRSGNQEPCSDPFSQLVSHHDPLRFADPSRRLDRRSAAQARRMRSVGTHVRWGTQKARSRRGGETKRAGWPALSPPCRRRLPKR